MKLTGLFKRGAACLCTAAILMGGVSAFALSPALPDEPAPAELSVTNAVSEAQLRSALSKLTVTYDSEAEGWQIDSPYEEASMEGVRIFRCRRGTSRGAHIRKSCRWDG